MFGHKLAVSTVLLVTVCWSTLVSAAEWILETNVYTRFLRTDNVYLSVDNEQAASGAVLSPSVKFTRAEATQNLSALADVSMTRYRDESIKDREEGIFDLDWLQSTERSQYGMQGYYSQYSSLNQTLENSGITDQPVDVITQSLSPFWRYRLSETWNFDITYTFSDVEYDEPGLDGFDVFKVVNFINYNTDKFDLNLIKTLTPRDALYLSISDTKYEGESGGLQIDGSVFVFVQASERELEYDYRVYQVGYAHDFTETQNITLFVGKSSQDVVNRSRPHLFDQAGQEVAVDLWVNTESSNRGDVYNVSYSIKDELSVFSVTIGQDRTSDSTGGLVERSHANVQYKYSPSERTAYGLKLNAEDRDLDDDTRISQSGDRVRGYFSTSINYKLAESWYITGEYRYAYSDRDGASEPAKSNALYLSMNWRDKSFY